MSACGGGGGSVVTPSPSNRSPVAAADSTVTLDEDSAATELNISAPTNPDTGDTLSIKVDSVPSGGEIVASAGGKDITGDGFPDTVLFVNTDNTWLDLVIIPGGQDIDGDVTEVAYFVTYWNYYYEYIPTDIDLGDINGDGYADIVLGFGNEIFTDYDYDDDGFLDNTHGMVEIIHGATLQSLVNDPVTWTTFLSPNGTDTAEFGADIAIGDFNNDGFDDILVGAPMDGNGPLIDSDEGAFHIIYGQSDLKINTYDGDDLYGENDYGISIQISSEYSSFTDSEMGDSVAVGDFNGDGIDDIAVSSNEAGLTEGDEGIVTIYLGQNFGDPQEAVVINVGADSIQKEDGSIWYICEVAVDKSATTSLGKTVKILPGMIAQVDIISGEKTVMEYLLQPVTKIANEAFRER